MFIKKQTIKLASLLGLVLVLISQPAIAFNYADWNDVLRKHVDEQGLVNYQQLSRDRTQFDRVIQSIKTSGPNTDPEQYPDRNHQLAYYINAYNALVFDGVLNRGPEQESVWSGLISGYNFFVRMDIEIDAEQISLKTLEDDIIRDQYMDPRIHAALNCASISCPRLPQQAFEPQNLDQQLDAAMREFVALESNVRVDETSRRVYLSKIFDWFKDDFIVYEKAQGNPDPSLISYINRYRSPAKTLATDYQIKFVDYDKGLNRQM